MGFDPGSPLSVFALIETTTFASVWYWIITVVSWSVTCHWTIGVPNDALVQADRHGGADAAQVQAMAAANAARLAALMASAGPWITAVAAFLLAMLGTVGFWIESELAKGAFLLLAPLAVVAGANARLAVMVVRDRLEGAELRRRIARRRFFNQIIGLAAISLAAVVGATYIMPGVAVPWPD